MNFVTKPKVIGSGGGGGYPSNKPFTYKPVRERVGNDTFNYAKNAPERFFHSKEQPISKWHELYFGPPQRVQDTGYSSNWQTLNEWPLAYLERNLTKSSRILWTLAKWQQMESWIEEIAPLQLDNSMSFTVQTKVYTDDLAEFIGLSAPVSEVAIAVSEKTQNVSYIGKGTSIHVNMMSSDEGRQELNEKLMLVANSINKTELWDVIYRLRRTRFAGIEAKRMKIWGKTDEYFAQEKQEWDSVRKYKHGMEKILEDISRIASIYDGQLDRVISAEPVFGNIIFKDEYTNYSRKGGKQYALYDQHDRDVSGSPGNPFDKVRAGVDMIKGFKIHKVQRLVTTKHDIYQDVLARYKQIGEHAICYNRRDESFSRPYNFKKEHLEFKMYDEEKDKFTSITYRDCVNNSLAFNSDGKVRKVDSSSGNVVNLKYDPFIKHRDGVLKPISLIGEINVHPRYVRDWEKKLAYVSATMNCHFNNGYKKLTSSEMEKYEKLFSYLEKVPYDILYVNKLSDLNFVSNKLEKKKNQDSHYKETQLNDEPLPHILKQHTDTGFYKLPSYKFPFGAANHWGVEAISKMEKKKLNSEYEQSMVETAKHWVERMNVHTIHLQKSLPDCQFINVNNYRKFCPTVFDNPKPQYNLWINGVNNTTNFLWLNTGPFGDITVVRKVEDNDDPKKDLSDGRIKFYDSIKGNVRYYDIASGDDIDIITIEEEDANSVKAMKQLANHLEYKTATGDQTLLKQLKDYGYIETKYQTDDSLSQQLESAFGFTTVGQAKIKMPLIGLFKQFEHDSTAFKNPWKAGMPVTRAFWKIVTGETLTINNTTDNDVVITSGVNTKLSVQPTVEAFLKALKTAAANDNPKLQRFKSNIGIFKTWFGLITSAFIIWLNSKTTANNLSIRTQRPVKTTMTLNEHLRKSIVSQNGGHVIMETEYKFTDDGKYIAKPKQIKNVEDSALNLAQYLNSGSLHRRKNVWHKTTFWPFHIWFNAMLMKKMPKSENSYSPVDRDGSLDFENIAPRNIGYMWTKNAGNFTFIGASRTILNMLPVSIKENKNIFETMNTVVLYLSDCSRDNMLGLYENGSCPPVEYIVFRPYMEYGTYPLIVCGSRCARRIRGNPLFMMGLDPVTAIMKFRYAQSSGTIIAQERDIFVLEDAFVWSSFGGGGTMFFNPDDYLEHGKIYYDPEESVYGNYEVGSLSLFSVSTPLGSARKLPIDIDLSGHYQELLRKGWSVNEILKGPPAYPMAERFVRFWNITSIGKGSRTWQFEPANTRTAQCTMIYRDEGGDFKDKINSQSHWGETATYEGVKVYRNGQAHTPKKPL